MTDGDEDDERVAGRWALLLALWVGFAALAGDRRPPGTGAAALRRVGLDPGQDTPSISFHSRTYLRGREYPALPAGVERLADGPAGSGLYSLPPIPGSAPAGVSFATPRPHHRLRHLRRPLTTGTRREPAIPPRSDTAPGGAKIGPWRPASFASGTPIRAGAC